MADISHLIPAAMCQGWGYSGESAPPLRAYLITMIEAHDRYQFTTTEKRTHTWDFCTGDLKAHFLLRLVAKGRWGMT